MNAANVNPSSELPEGPVRAEPRRLYRSRQDRMIAGVAGGLGQYFNVDPVLIRLGWVLLGLSGFGVLAYIILAVVVPERPEGEPEPAITASTVGIGGGRMLAGAALVILGLLLLADNLRIFEWDRFWPLLLILLGVAILIGRKQPE